MLYSRTFSLQVWLVNGYPICTGEINFKFLAWNSRPFHSVRLGFHHHARPIATPMNTVRLCRANAQTASFLSWKFPTRLSVRFPMHRPRLDKSLNWIVCNDRVGMVHEKWWTSTRETQTPQDVYGWMMFNVVEQRDTSASVLTSRGASTTVHTAKTSLSGVHRWVQVCEPTPWQKVLFHQHFHPKMHLTFTIFRNSFRLYHDTFL